MSFLTSLRPGPESLPAGGYAMWFPSNPEPLFAPSETRKNLGRLYAALRGIQTYAFGSILSRIANPEEHVATGGEEVPQVALPRDLAIFPVVGPEEQVFALSASREKGLRLHFHETATPAYRNQVLTEFSAFAEAMGRVFHLAGYPFDESTEESPEKWWDYCDKVAADMEASQGKPLDAVGKLVTGDPTQTAAPSPEKPWWKFW